MIFENRSQIKSCIRCESKLLKIPSAAANLTRRDFFQRWSRNWKERSFLSRHLSFELIRFGTSWLEHCLYISLLVNSPGSRNILPWIGKVRFFVYFLYFDNLLKLIGQHCQQPLLLLCNWKYSLVFKAHNFGLIRPGTQGCNAQFSFNYKFDPVLNLPSTQLNSPSLASFRFPPILRQRSLVSKSEVSRSLY